MRLRGIISVLIVLYVMIVAMLYVFQRPLIYGNKFRELNMQPALLGLANADIVKVPTPDGETLEGWHVRPASERQTVYLYFHGKGGALGNRAVQFRALVRSGRGLLAIDYRGFGDSTGSPSEQGLYRDAEAAYDWLVKRADPKRIVIVGESLGAGVATWLAAHRPAGALVLLAPFTSIVDIAELQYPVFPVRWLMIDQFRADLKIKDVHIPLLIVHGTADYTVPIRYGMALFVLANEPKRMLRYKGAGHRDLVQFGAFDGIASFVADTIEGPVQDH